MSFFGAGFDPREDAPAVLTLVDVDTPDGNFGFMPGIDGKFTDSTGKVWWGSVLIDQPALEMPLNGAAPAGQIAMTFFQDPDMPDVVAQIAALGRPMCAGGL
jgi:hypothetical protein